MRAWLVTSEILSEYKKAKAANTYDAFKPLELKSEVRHLRAEQQLLTDLVRLGLNNTVRSQVFCVAFKQNMMACLIKVFTKGDVW